jgi:hypothetical protein
MKSILLKRMGKILMIIGLAILLSGTGWADRPGRKPALGQPPEAGEGVGDDLQRIHATIEKKSLENITTSTGEKFAVSENTIIVGTDGQQVSIRAMLVPCEAEIGHRLDNGVRTAERITIQRVGSNATWHWTSEKSN